MRITLLSTTAIQTSLSDWFWGWISQNYIPHGQGKRRSEARARRVRIKMGYPQ